MVFSDIAGNVALLQEVWVKLSLIFGFAKSSKYKTNFKLSLKPKLLVACVTGGLFLSKLRLNRKFFTLLLAKSNFHVSAFLLVIFGSLFQVFSFRFKNLRKKNQVSAFQVSVGKFRFSRFCFSRFCFQIPTFRLLLSTPIFTLLLCKLLAESMLIFWFFSSA